MDLKIGDSVIVRTPTYHYTGRYAGVETIGNLHYVCLSDAAWIAKSGRWHTAIAHGVYAECEPYPDVSVVRLNLLLITEIATLGAEPPRQAT